MLSWKRSVAKIVAVIPARAGSKGVRDKNFRSFFEGSSLVDIAIDFSLNLNVDDIYVSTDKKDFQPKVSGVRLHPRELRYAQDNSTDFDVLKNLFVDNILTTEDTLVWIRPTNPMRSSNECNAAIEKFACGFGSIRSIKKADMHPFWMKKIKDDKLVPFTTEGDDIEYPQRQLLPPAYQISSEFEIISVGKAMTQQYFYPDEKSYFVTSAHRKIDIDTEADFELAQLLYERTQ